MDVRRPVFCVIGAGHGGMAMAGHLGMMGFEVRLYNRTATRLEGVRALGGVDITGEEIVGFGPISCATADAGEAISGADVVMVAVPATAHENIAAAASPHLTDGQYVVLNPGRTFGAIAFHQELRRSGCAADVTIAETQTFIYASRATGPAQVRIFAVKSSIPLATLQAHRIPDCLGIVRQAYPQFVPGDSVFKTSFNNIGAVFHPALVLLNAGWVEDPADFEFYHQGATPSVVQILEELDAERVRVAASLGFRAMTAREWLYFAYSAVGADLRSAMRANPGYRGINAPKRTEMRYVTEDIPCSLVPMSSIGHAFGVDVRIMDALITVASAMHGRDYRAEGRTLERLGIAGLGRKELRLLAIGEGAA